MLAFFKRIFYYLSILWGVASLIFFLFQVLPGDPARMMLDQREDSKQLEAIRKKYGFDLPIYQQYFYYLKDISPISLHAKASYKEHYNIINKYKPILRVNLGTFDLILKKPYLRESFQKNGQNVGEIIAQRFTNTLVLAVSAIVIAFILGLVLGVLSALNKDSWLDQFLVSASSLGMSLPSFFCALLLVWLFGFVLHDYTHLNMQGNLYEIDDYGEKPELVLRNLILPSITLGMRPLSVITQLMRNSLIDTLKQSYIKTAYAKGLSKWAVVFKHALRNALNPVITATSGWFASMLAGAVFVEYIFGWKGLGKQLVDSLNEMDLPIIMGIVLTISIGFIIINFLVDLIYIWLDPRVQNK